MSILFCDDFNSYGGNPAYMLNGLYAEIAGHVLLLNDPDPVSAGSKCLYLSGLGGNPGLGAWGSVVRMVNPGGSRATIGGAVRVWLSALPNTTNAFLGLSLTDFANVDNVFAQILPNGAVRTWRGPTPGSGAVLDDSDPALVANAWNLFEWQSTADNAAGAVEFRVNSTPVTTLAGVDTVAGTANFGHTKFFNCQIGDAINPGMYLKDFVIRDDQGSVNNSFTGTARCIRLPVDGDVLLNWATSSGSTGWNLLDESPPNDAGCIYAGDPPPGPCTMTFANLPPDITSVLALMTLVRASNSDGGDGRLRVSLVSDGAGDDGADRQLTVADSYYFDVSEINPHTSAPWTPGNTDTGNIRFDRTL